MCWDKQNRASFTEPNVAPVNVRLEWIRAGMPWQAALPFSRAFVSVTTCVAVGSLVLWFCGAGADRLKSGCLADGLACGRGWGGGGPVIVLEVLSNEVIRCQSAANKDVLLSAAVHRSVCVW